MSLGFKVMCELPFEVDVKGKEEKEEKLVKITSEVFDIAKKSFNGETKSEFLVYDKKAGFLWVDSDDCDLAS